MRDVLRGESVAGGIYSAATEAYAELTKELERLSFNGSLSVVADQLEKTEAARRERAETAEARCALKSFESAQ